MHWRAIGILWIATATLPVAGAPDPSPPVPAHETDERIAVLERAFWFCDYTATTQGVLAAPVAACRYATEELRKAKFDGDYASFLAWWRDNKPAEHAKLDAAR